MKKKKANKKNQRLEKRCPPRPENPTGSGGVGPRINAGVIELHNVWQKVRQKTTFGK